MKWTPSSIAVWRMANAGDVRPSHWKPLADRIFRARGQGMSDETESPAVPRWGPRLARLYSEDVRKLEALHAGRLAPGASTWEQAVESLFKKLVKAGPAKGTKLVKKTIDYLGSIDSCERSHFMVANHCASRTAILMFATFRIGPHPDPRVIKEEGLSIELHILQCSRSHPSYTVGVPVAYISRHAMNRLYERGHDITDNSHATSVFAFIGVLGFLTHRSKKHADGGMHMVFSDLLMAGSLHCFTKTYYSGRQFEETIFDVRTVLSANELGDSQWALLEQGRAAAGAVAAWFRDAEGDLDESRLAEAIPRLERREDGYPLRVAGRSTG
jgi:hypothetical protein